MSSSTSHISGFLDTAPARQDLFGSHQGVADTMYNIVTGVPDSLRNRAIALLGPQGSGKSTIIELLRNALTENETTHLYLFSTWHHSGEFLRREFLLGLLDSFYKRNWITEHVHAHLKLRLTHRRTDRRTTDVTPLSVTWRVFLFACLFTPLLKQYAGPLLWPSIEVLGYYGFLLLFFFQLWADIQNRAPSEAVDRLLGQFRRKTPAHTRTIENVSVENSTRELVDVYAAILKAALIDDAGGKRRQAIVVFDDIDRLEPAAMRQVCDDLNIFTDYKFEEGDPVQQGVRRTWIIACFDAEQMEQAYGPPPAPPPAQTPGEILTNAAAVFPASTHAPRTAVERYLERQFLTVLHVPSPLGLMERKFVYQKMKTAFPHADERQVSVLYRLFRRRQESVRRHSTVRDIFVFLNRLVPLQMAWTERRRQAKEREIPFHTQAIFVLMNSASVPFDRVLQQIDDALHIYGDIIEGEDKINFTEDYSSLVFNRTHLPYAAKMIGAAKNNNATLLAETVDQILAFKNDPDETNLFWFLFEQAVGPLLYRMRDPQRGIEIVFQAIQLLDPATNRVFEHFSLKWPKEHLQRKDRTDDVYESGAFVLWEMWVKIGDEFVERRRKHAESDHERDEIIRNRLPLLASMCLILRSFDMSQSAVPIAGGPTREFLRLCFLNPLFSNPGTNDYKVHANLIRAPLNLLLAADGWDGLQACIQNVFEEVEDKAQEKEIARNCAAYEAQEKNPEKPKRLIKTDDE